MMTLGAFAGPALPIVMVWLIAAPGVYSEGVVLIAAETSALPPAAWQSTTARITQSPETPRLSDENQKKLPGPREA